MCYQTIFDSSPSLKFLFSLVSLTFFVPLIGNKCFPLAVEHTHNADISIQLLSFILSLGYFCTCFCCPFFILCRLFSFFFPSFRVYLVCSSQRCERPISSTRVFCHDHMNWSTEQSSKMAISLMRFWRVKFQRSKKPTHDKYFFSSFIVVCSFVSDHSYFA